MLSVIAYEKTYELMCAGVYLCACTRLLDVLMQDSRLYLIFEFLSMDLKKYLDSIPSGQYMDPMLVKVSISLLQQYNSCLKLNFVNSLFDFYCPTGNAAIFKSSWSKYQIYSPLLCCFKL